MSKILPILTSSFLLLAAPAALADVQAADVKSADKGGTSVPGSGVKTGVDAWSDGDYTTAVRLWQPLADRGDADALFNLAQAYKLGRGEPLDLTKAEELYGKAAAKGHVQAADAYGLLLFQRGERQRALPYIEGSASRGDPRAQYILGIAHFNGDVVKKDWVRAYALASLARQAGLAQATAALAQMDQHIPLADRQKSVPLAQQLAAQAQANRQQLNASAELGTSIAVAEPAPARGAAKDTTKEGPATAGADYARPRNVPASAAPRPTQPTPTPAPAPAKLAAAAVASKPEPKPPESKPLPKPAPKPAPAAASGPWRVQLGAFGVAGNAEALWAKIKGRPELAGHPRALVPPGRLTKLQATGFASKADADAACARLSAGGFGCLPSRD